MARVELVRGYEIREESNPNDVKQRLTRLYTEGIQEATDELRPLEGNIVGPDEVSTGRTNAGFLPRIDDPEVGKAALLVSSDDEKVLETIEAFIALLLERLAAARHAEMERLIETAMPRLSGTPHPAILDQARRNADFRGDFLKSYNALAAAQVHDLAGSKADNTAALAARWRSSGKIFGVEHQGRILYPAFQFNDTGRPKPVVAAVLKALGRRSPWQVASWFTAPNGWLPDDQRPIDVMDTDPDVVANAAREATRPSVF